MIICFNNLELWEYTRQIEFSDGIFAGIFQQGYTASFDRCLDHCVISSITTSDATAIRQEWLSVSIEYREPTSEVAHRASNHKLASILSEFLSTLDHISTYTPIIFR